MKHREQFSLSATAETVFNPDQVAVCLGSDAPISHVLEKCVGFSINSSPSEGETTGAVDGTLAISTGNLMRSTEQHFRVCSLDRD